MAQGIKLTYRKYKCGCGFKGHRDIIGAANIISAPVVVGNRLSA
jgi:transposase